MSSNTLKRVKILLAPAVYLKLQRLAESRGCPISKIVGKWFSESDRLNLLVGKIYPERRSVTLELRMNLQEWLHLEALSDSLGISASSTLVRIIQYNLDTNIDLSDSAVIISKTWQSGMFNNLPPDIYGRLDTLDIKSIYNLIRINVEVGHLGMAKDLINHFERLLQTGVTEIKWRGLLAICKSRVARLDKDLAGTKENALEALSLGELLADDHLVGLANFRLGIFDLGRGELSEGLFHLEKAATYLPVNQDPFIQLQIQLMKALIAAARYDDVQYSIHIKLCADLLRRYPNAYFQAYNNSIELQKGYLYHEPGIYSKALQNIELSKSSGSILMSFDAYEFAGMVGTTTNEDYFAVRHKLDNAFNLERQFRPETETSTSKLFKFVNIAKQNYVQVTNQLRSSRQAISNNGLEPEFYNYVFSAVDYIYAPDSLTKKKSQEQLARLKASTQSPHVQVAAEHTLNQRELAPVIL